MPDQWDLFDFDVLEAEMRESWDRELASGALRDRAAAAWVADQEGLRAQMLATACDRLQEVLGVANGSDVETHVTNPDGAGYVRLTVDGMRFQIQFTNSDSPPVLGVKTKGTPDNYAPVRSLVQLGHKLACDQIYEVRPPAPKEEEFSD